MLLMQTVPNRWQLIDMSRWMNQPGGSSLQSFRWKAYIVRQGDEHCLGHLRQPRSMPSADGYGVFQSHIYRVLDVLLPRASSATPEPTGARNPPCRRGP